MGIRSDVALVMPVAFEERLFAIITKESKELLDSADHREVETHEVLYRWDSINFYLEFSDTPAAQLYELLNEVEASYDADADYGYHLFKFTPQLMDDYTPVDTYGSFIPEEFVPQIESKMIID